MTKSFYFLGLAMAYGITSVMGHMGMWDPSVYGFDGPPAEVIQPLAGKPFERWWFHGQIKSHPPKNGAVFKLPAGGVARVQLACGKQHTSFGGAPDSMNAPCPSDPAAAHAGNPPKDSSMRGCGLAIAYKSNAGDVKKEDFVIFSVNHMCVKHRWTEFPVPAGMPPCPNGKCVCAWFWQGFESNDEIYMNGFDCTITNPGQRVIDTPKAPKPCHGNPNACVKGAKSPMYLFNLDPPNVPFPGRAKMPAYDGDWGYPNGAQQIFKDAPPAQNPNPNPPKPNPPNPNPPKPNPPANNGPKLAPEQPANLKPNQKLMIMPDGSKAIFETVVQTVVVQGRKREIRKVKRTLYDEPTNLKAKAKRSFARRGRIPNYKSVNRRQAVLRG